MSRISPGIYQCAIGCTRESDDLIRICIIGHHEYSVWVAAVLRSLEAKRGNSAQPYKCTERQDSFNHLHASSPFAEWVTPAENHRTGTAFRYSISGELILNET